MHWHLDVTFKEEFEIGEIKALRRKRYAICNNPEKYIRRVLEL